mgnify:FL=1
MAEREPPSSPPGYVPGDSDSESPDIATRRRDPPPGPVVESVSPGERARGGDSREEGGDLDDYDNSGGGSDDPATPGTISSRSGLELIHNVKEGSECRICLMDHTPFCKPCRCQGTMGHVHPECLARWCRETGVTKCELCHSTFPQYFIDAGKRTRRVREREQADAQEASERLAAQTANFQVAYGRPPSTAMDYAVINLNSMLEAEAAMRQRARENNGVEDRQFNESVRVVVIDSSGRPQAVSMGELHGASGGGGRLGLQPVLGANGNQNYDLGLNVPPAIVNHQLSFWARVVVSTLCVFLVLYIVVAIIAASSDAGRDSYPVFIFRLLGFMLPLLLISRAVYVFRRRREQAMINTVNDMFIRHHAQTAEVRPAGGNGAQRERGTRRMLDV